MKTQNWNVASNRHKTLVLILGLCSLCRCQTYQEAMSILDDKLNSNVYNVDVRPLNDQSQTLIVHASFVLVSIVEVNDVSQSFTCNGFLSLVWNDELLTWTPSDYGGATRTYPQYVNIFKPRLVLMNTIADRDIFEDDNGPLVVYSNGTVSLAPGSLFETSCELDMRKFPFDKQNCSIQMVSMRYTAEEMQFVSVLSDLDLGYLIPNGEWRVTSAKCTVQNTTDGVSEYSSLWITFELERRPTVLMLNIILPIIFLSFLNLLVFFVPLDSGEKLGYSITGLLTLTVFMSIVSGMMPSSSSNVPAVTIYLFFLLILSLLTVVQSIVVLHLHHREEKEANYEKAKMSFKHIFKKFVKVRAAIRPSNGDNDTEASHDINKPNFKTFFNKCPSVKDTEEKISQNQREEGEDSQMSMTEEINKKIEEANEDSNKPKGNMFKTIVHNIDRISFWVFLTLWIASSFVFLITVLAD